MSSESSSQDAKNKTNNIMLMDTHLFPKRISELLNNLIIKTFFHVLPFYHSIRSFEKNFKQYYFSNDEYSYLIDEMVICTVMGFYKWSYVDCKLIDAQSRFLQLTTKYINFYKMFVLQKKKNRFVYLKKTFISKGYLKYIIQEYIVYIITKNKSSLAAKDAKFAKV